MLQNTSYISKRKGGVGVHPLHPQLDPPLRDFSKLWQPTESASYYIQRIQLSPP